MIQIKRKKKIVITTIIAIAVALSIAIIIGVTVIKNYKGKGEYIINGRFRVVVSTGYGKIPNSQDGVDAFRMHSKDDRAKFTKDHVLLISRPLLNYLTGPDVEHMLFGRVSVRDQLQGISSEAKSKNVLVKISLRPVVKELLLIAIYMKEDTNASLDEDVIDGLGGLQEKEKGIVLAFNGLTLTDKDMLQSYVDVIKHKDIFEVVIQNSLICDVCDDMKEVIDMVKADTNSESTVECGKPVHVGLVVLSKDTKKEGNLQLRVASASDIINYVVINMAKRLANGFNIVEIRYTRPGNMDHLRQTMGLLKTVPTMKKILFYSIGYVNRLKVACEYDEDSKTISPYDADRCGEILAAWLNSLKEDSVVQQGMGRLKTIEIDTNPITIDKDGYLIYSEKTNTRSNKTIIAIFNEYRKGNETKFEFRVDSNLIEKPDN